MLERWVMWVYLVVPSWHDHYLFSICPADPQFSLTSPAIEEQNRWWWYLHLKSKNRWHLKVYSPCNYLVLLMFPKKCIIFCIILNLSNGLGPALLYVLYESRASEGQNSVGCWDNLPLFNGKVTNHPSMIPLLKTLYCIKQNHLFI